MLAAGTACGGGHAPAPHAAGATAPSAGITTGAAGAPAPGQAELDRRLRSLEASSHRHIGAFALDTDTGRTVGYRMDETFPLLSTWKAVEAAAVLDRAHRSRPALLGQVIRWRPDQEVPGGPVTKGRGAAGMTVSQLVRAAVTASDNTAANLLLGPVGGPAALTGYFRSLDDPLSRLDRPEPDLNSWRPGERRDTTTPAAMGRDLYRITLGPALGAEDRGRLTGWLRACTTGDARIRAGLPRGWTVGDKTGTNSAFGGANDIAVAWPPSGGAPVVLTVYTYGGEGTAVDEKTVASTAALLVRALSTAR